MPSASKSPCKLGLCAEALEDYTRTKGFLSAMAPVDCGQRLGAGLSQKQLLKRALEAFDEHRTAVAGRYLQEAEARGALPALDAGSSAKVDHLRDAYSRVLNVRQSLVSDDGWEVQRDHDGIRCLYQEHSSGFVRLRLDAEVDAPMFDIIALMREVDLWKRWVPSFGGLGLLHSRQLGQTSILNMCFHVEVGMPWPLATRCATFAVDGVDCMTEEDTPQQVAVLLDCNLAQNNCSEKISDVVSGDAMPVLLWDSGVIITPAEVAGTKHTLMQIIIVADPKMYVPRWLVNLAVRNFCYLLMVQIKKAIRVTRTEEYLSATADPTNQFYAFIRRRLKESLPAQYAAAPTVRSGSELQPAAPQKRSGANYEGGNPHSPAGRRHLHWIQRDKRRGSAQPTKMI
eukprot:TRINITY_DN16092_c0_g1_i2.p1 TRINITY_DN16092_c0_g1~~TRINITY_DN16092_c0_g1_i2.p1  ORF type:complete len:399 (-),score=82.76 TRINITY_DN16092_c0_g1_i2:17-1213(-)